MFITRLILFVYAVFFLGLGGYTFWMPESIANSSFLEATTYSSSFINEMRAVYGGLQFGIGVVFLMATFSYVRKHAVLGWATFLFTCLAGARIGSAYMQGLTYDYSRVIDVSNYVNQAITFEAGSAIVLGLSYFLTRRSY